MHAQSLLQHLLISILPWAFGTTAGAVAGFLLARQLRERVVRDRSTRSILILIPWRTIALTAPFLAVFVPMWVGLGPMAGLIDVGVFVFLVAFPMTALTFLQSWSNAPASARLMSVVRLLGVGSISIATLAGPTGAGGLGAQLWSYMADLDYTGFSATLSWIAVLSLAVDLLLGGLQAVLTRVANAEAGSENMV
jgi:ABC-type nitrate/sulfonate/bicarbonate transport system permease component